MDRTTQENTVSRTLAGGLQRRLYWICSRLGMFLYRTFPVFGRLRGSIAIVESSGKYLVVERNDGLGICFPGGMANFRESPAETVLREFEEETGLQLHEVQELYRFDSNERISATTVVFRGKAEGQPRNSWEGKSFWMSLDEIVKRGVYAPHRCVIEYLRRDPDHPSASAN